MKETQLPGVLLPMPIKEVKVGMEFQKRVLFFDLSEIYSRIKIDHFKRQQSVSFKAMFPKVKGVCGCGCDTKLSGRKTRWASENCARFAVDVWEILRGYNLTIIASYLQKYYKRECCRCKGTTDLRIDHIIPVKHGGGGCWLSNFQILCHTCHVDKTKDDFGWKKKVKK